jgi:hypothetical protein
LEQENAELILRLRQYEGDRPPHNLGDSLASTDDELMNDTKPTLNEQAALNVALDESTVSEPILPSGSTFEDHVVTVQAPICYEVNGELEHMSAQRTETIAMLNQLMQKICGYLNEHDQRSLAEQLENELRTYQLSPDLDLVIVTSQTRRFVDEVIESLVHEISILNTEKRALQTEYQLAQLTMAEAGLLEFSFSQFLCFRRCAPEGGACSRTGN